MRIGVVTTSYPRHGGDPAGHFVAGLNRFLVARGHHVEVLAAGPAEPVPTADTATDAARRVVRIPSPLFYDGGAPDRLATGTAADVVEALRFSVALGRRLRAEAAGYDALVSHWIVPCGVLAAALAGGRPHVAIAHSSDIHLLRRLEMEWVVRQVARRARLVYTTASLRVPGAPGVISPMGIDAAHFRLSADERAAARERLGWRRPTVLFLGRLVPVKGVATLLQAARRLPAVDLWLAGDGPLRGELTALAADLGERVRFFGEVAGALRRDLLGACDTLALPSLLLADGRTDGAPQVLLEALAAGLPVVASAVGGIPELLGDAGWLVPPGDPSGLATALAAALAVPRPLPTSERQAATYDWSVVAPRILEPILRCDRPTAPRGS